jgi:hypothetical protein
MTGQRPVGRPAKSERVITEGDYPELYSKWLRGTSVHALARAYGVDWTTANHHLQKCRQVVRSTMVRERNEVLDELAQLRSLAYECFERSKRTLTHDEVAREVDKVAQDKGIDSELASRIVKQTTKLTMRDGEATWLTVALAAIDMECKLTGHYEAGKREGSKPAGKGSYRAAGRSPAETNKAMLERVAAVLTRQREALTNQVN